MDVSTERINPHAEVRRSPPPEANITRHEQPTRKHWASPTIGAALSDSISSQTAHQSALIRERSFQFAKLEGQNSPPGERPKGNTKWGTVQIPDPNSPTGHAPRGVRPEIHAEFHASANAPVEEAPGYALGMKSSIAFTQNLQLRAPSAAALARSGGNALPAVEHEVPFAPPAYAKHLGVDRPHPTSGHAAALISDRAPESVMERRRRQHLHRLLVERGGKPFNRKVQPGSLSDYAEKRMVLQKLIGDTHQPGDPNDIAGGVAPVKKWVRPDDNPSVASVASDPRYGLQGRGRADPGPYDVSLNQVRPRTPYVGFSTGHVRQVRGTANGRSLQASGRQPQGPHMPVLSGLARRTEYINTLYEDKARANARRREAAESRAAARDYALLQQEVEGGIEGFEANLADMKAKGWKGV